MKNYDIAIIGYGPVGAAAANIFGRKGFNIIVIEPKEEIWDIPRAVHFDGQTQRIFQEIGIMDDVKLIIDPADKIKFIDSNGETLVDLGMKGTYQPNGYNEDVFFNQPLFEEILRKKAQEYSNIDFKLGYSVTGLEPSDTSNYLTISNKHNEIKIESKYVLGCDGADSFVRKKLNIKSKDFKCDQDWIVADYIVDEKYKIDRCRYQICDYKRPTTMLPIVGNHVRWEFMLKPDDDISIMENDSTIRDLMEPHLWRLNSSIDKNSGELIRSSKYTFHGLLVNDFKYMNCFLAGDAAHQTPPFLGQGLCQGIKDSYNLCWKINGIENNNYSKSLLNSYTTERYEVNEFAINTAIKQQNIIASQSMIKSFIRDTFLRTARIFPKLLSFLSFSYDWKYSNGIIDNTLYPNKVNGIIIPHPDLNIKVDNLNFDGVIGDSFTLMLFDADPLTEKKVKEIENINIYNKVVNISNDSPFIDDLKFAEWTKKNKLKAVIIKPDKHIYGCCNDNDMLDKITKLTNKLHKDLYLN